MKEYRPAEDFHAFITSCIVEGLQILNLQDWRVIPRYIKVIPPYRHIPSEGGYTFAILPDHVYMEAHMDVSEKAQAFYRNGQHRYIREDVLHELAHIITWPITDGRKRTRVLVDLDENLTQKISVIAAKLLC